jgi:hypothetical protein
LQTSILGGEIAQQLPFISFKSQWKTRQESDLLCDGSESRREYATTLVHIAHLDSGFRVVVGSRKYGLRFSKGSQ